MSLHLSYNFYLFFSTLHVITSVIFFLSLISILLLFEFQKKTKAQAMTLSNTFIVILLYTLMCYVVKLFYFNNSKFQFLNYPNNFYFTYFSDIFICLVLITTLIALTYLSERSLYKNFVYIMYFYIFFVCTLGMVTTKNLLTMFLYFEFIFLPSLFFVYQFSYSKKSIKTVGFLLI